MSSFINYNNVGKAIIFMLMSWVAILATIVFCGLAYVIVSQYTVPAMIVASISITILLCFYIRLQWEDCNDN